MVTCKLWWLIIVLFSAPWNVVNGFSNDKFHETIFQQKGEAIVDKILDSYKNMVKVTVNDKGEIQLDDIGKEFTERYLGMINANFLAKNGYLSSVLNIRRLGPVSARSRKEAYPTVIIKSNVGFSHLRVTYERLIIVFPLLGEIEGKLEINIRHTELEATMELVFGNQCTARLLGLKVLKFGKLIPSVTGLGTMNSVAKGVIARFLVAIKKQGRAKIENYFYNRVKNTIGLFNICAALKGFFPNETAYPPNYIPPKQVLPTFVTIPTGQIRERSAEAICSNYGNNSRQEAF